MYVPKEDLNSRKSNNKIATGLAIQKKIQLASANKTKSKEQNPWGITIVRTKYLTQGEKKKMEEETEIGKIGKNDPPHQIQPKLDQDVWNNSQIWQSKRNEKDLSRNKQEM